MNEFINEGFIPGDDIFSFLLIQESMDEDKLSKFKELIMDPIIDKLENSPSVRKRYIEFGTEFVEANAEWLSREYPTLTVSYPRRYVDKLVELFGWTTAEIKKIVTDLCLDHDEIPPDPSDGKVKVNRDFRVMTPTNFIHTVVLNYSDMKLQTELRKSARQQLGMSIYDVVYAKWFKARYIDEKIMAYTYGTLDRTFGLVQAENVVTWINNQIDVSYQFWKSKISLNLSTLTIVLFLGRVFTTFDQAMGLLAKRFHENYGFSGLVGSDTQNSDHVVTDNFNTLKNNLIRLIRTKDSMYWNRDSILYDGVAKMKKVKANELHDLAIKVEIEDIDNIITLILYCFLTKDGNDVKDIQSHKYYEAITKFPTKIDRVIERKPVIAPFVKKYKTSAELCKAYIVLLAIYIMNKLNEIKPE